MDIVLTFILYTFLVISVTYLVGYSVEHKRKQMKILILAAFLCGLVAAFRGTTGCDSSMYMDAYRYGTSSITRWSDFEFGFVMLVRFLNMLRLPYHAMFFVMAFVPALAVFKAIIVEKALIDVKVATFIYVSDLYFFGLNGMRQQFAICLCLYAFVLFFRNKKRKAFVLIAIACLFHRSALMCFIVIGINLFYKSKHKRVIITVIIIAALTLVSNRRILGDLITAVTRNSYYGGYVTRDADTGTTIFKYYLKNLPLFLIPALQIKKMRKDNRYYVFLLLMVVGLILSSLGAITATQVSRIGMYFSYMKIFTCAYCAKLPEPIKVSSVNGVRLNKYLIYSFFSLMYYYSYFIRGFSLIVPYGKAL